MSGRYREHAAPERLRPYVECFWTLDPGEALPEYPVMPDGCVDIVYSPGTAEGLQVVGAMTQARKFPVPAGQFAMGVRFRPGMAPAFVRAPGSETTDRLLPLGDVWGAEGWQLEAQVAEAKSAKQCVALLEAQLVDPGKPGVVQRVAAYIVNRTGQVRVDDLAFDAGMSARQLRRLFVEQIGLTPKHFCRVIRFRHSLSRLGQSRRGDWTQVALECGYYDQAHFINEFKELSGYSPGEFVALLR